MDKLIFIQQPLIWHKVAYSGKGFYMTDDSPRPKDGKRVLVICDAMTVPFVSWCGTINNCAFWMVNGGGVEKRFMVTHWCDCLPDEQTYLHLIELKRYD